jgi:hypothetical protein
MFLNLWTALYPPFDLSLDHFTLTCPALNWHT